jgi:hypothetical protein
MMKIPPKATGKDEFFAHDTSPTMKGDQDVNTLKDKNCVHAEKHSRLRIGVIPICPEISEKEKYVLIYSMRTYRNIGIIYFENLNSQKFPETKKFPIRGNYETS